MEAAKVLERMKAKRGDLLERYPMVMSSIPEMVNAHGFMIDMTVETLTKLRLLYRNGKNKALRNAAEFMESRQSVTELEGV